MVKSIKSLLHSPGQTASCDEIRKEALQSHQQTRARWTVTGPRRPPAARVQNGARPPLTAAEPARVRRSRGAGARDAGAGDAAGRAGVKEAARLRGAGSGRARRGRLCLAPSCSGRPDVSVNGGPGECRREPRLEAGGAGLAGNRSPDGLREGVSLSKWGVGGGGRPETGSGGWWQGISPPPETPSPLGTSRRRPPRNPGLLGSPLILPFHPLGLVRLASQGSRSLVAVPAQSGGLEGISPHPLMRRAC